MKVKTRVRSGERRGDEEWIEREDERARARFEHARGGNAVSILYTPKYRPDPEMTASDVITIIDEMSDYLDYGGGRCVFRS